MLKDLGHSEISCTSWLTFCLKHPCVPNCGVILDEVKLNIYQISGAPLTFSLSHLLLTKMYKV